MKKGNHLFIIATILILISVSTVFSIQDYYIGFSQIWSTSMWEEAIYRKYNTDYTYFTVKEWPRLNGLGANTIQNHVGNENTHIQSYGDLGMNVIGMQYPLDSNGNIWTENIYSSHEGAYATATGPDDAVNWPFHYTLQRYTDDGYPWLLTKLEETIDAMQNKYSFGSNAFAGYDFAQETWQNFHTATELNRAFAIIDHGVEHIRKRDIINPVRISMNFFDPIRRSVDDPEIYDPDPFTTFPVCRPFSVDSSGAGWNIYTNFNYSLYSEDYIDEQYGQDKWSSYFGYDYQDRLDKKLNAMLQGSRWIYDYKREFYNSGFQGPEPFWVECIQAQNSYSLYDNSESEGFVYRERHRRPRDLEYKVNSYLGLIAGAEGIAFWPYNGSNKSTDGYIQFANGVVLDEKPDYELMPMQSQTDAYPPLTPPRPYKPWVRDIHRGIIYWEWEDHEDEDFRTPIENEWVHENRFQANPYTDIYNAFDQEIKHRLPVIKSLDWVWAVTGESDPDSTNGPGVVRAMNSFTPRPDDYPNALDYYFNLRDVLGDEELNNGDPTEEKTSNAKIGLFLNGSSPGVQYYLVLNSRCNRMTDLETIDDAPSDAFQFKFKSTSGQIYKLYDVFTNTLLWQATASSNTVTTGNITFQPAEARLLKFIQCGEVDEKSGSLSGSNTWGNANGTPKHYRLTGSISISGANNSLTILPNTTIEVEGYYQIAVDNGGELKIQGSEECPVIFKPSAEALYNTADTLRVWSGIYYYPDAYVNPTDTVKNVKIFNSNWGIASTVVEQNFKNIEANYCSNGIYLFNVSSFPPSGDKTVINGTFKKCNIGVFSLLCHDLLLRNIWVEDAVMEGIQICASSGDVQVEDSNIIHSGRQGIKVYNQSSGSVFIGDTTNVLYNGCEEGFTPYSGVLVDNVSYFVLGNRLSIDLNKYLGLKLDNGSDCTLLGVEIAENGRLYDNGFYELEIFISGDSHIFGPDTWGPNAIYDEYGYGDDTSTLIRCSSNYNSIYDVFDGDSETIDTERYKDGYSHDIDVSDPNNGILYLELPNPQSKSDDFFLPPIATVSPTDLLASAKEYFTEGNYSQAQNILEDIIATYPNESISCAAQNLLFNLLLTSGYSLNELITELETIPENMTGYKPLKMRQELIAKYYIMEGSYDLAQQKYLEITEFAETTEDSLKALVAYEQVAIIALMVDMANNDGRRTSSIVHQDEQRNLAIINHQEKIDELNNKIYRQYANSNSTPLPAVSRLQLAYPNPFNPSVTIPFTLNKTQDVKVLIYNVLGQKVVELVNEQRVAGQHSIVWNGVNDHGLQVSSGIYFILMQTASGIDTRKIVMLK